MLGTLVAAAVEASIINLKAGTAIMVQMQKMLKGGNAIPSDADLMRAKFTALQRAFAVL